MERAMKNLLFAAVAVIGLATGRAANFHNGSTVEDTLSARILNVLQHGGDWPPGLFIPCTMRKINTRIPRMIRLGPLSKQRANRSWPKIGQSWPSPPRGAGTRNKFKGNRYGFDQ
jgi:hypothetical protein